MKNDVPLFKNLDKGGSKFLLCRPHESFALRDPSSDSGTLRDAPRGSGTFQDAIGKTAPAGTKPGIHTTTVIKGGHPRIQGVGDRSVKLEVSVNGYCPKTTPKSDIIKLP